MDVNLNAFLDYAKGKIVLVGYHMYIYGSPHDETLIVYFKAVCFTEDGVFSYSRSWRDPEHVERSICEEKWEELYNQWKSLFE